MLDIEFGAIRVVEPVGEGARVTLRDGRAWLLDGSNDFDADDKAVFVTRADGSVVAVAWGRVRRVEFGS